MGAKKYPIKCWETLKPPCPRCGSESGKKWGDGLC
nr:MAG TPA: restriction alleviation protein [Caudoviricetes sp.]